MYMDYYTNGMNTKAMVYQDGLDSESLLEEFKDNAIEKGLHFFGKMLGGDEKTALPQAYAALYGENMAEKITQINDEITKNEEKIENLENDNRDLTEKNKNLSNRVKAIGNAPAIVKSNIDTLNEEAGSAKYGENIKTLLITYDIALSTLLPGSGKYEKIRAERDALIARINDLDLNSKFGKFVNFNSTGTGFDEYKLIDGKITGNTFASLANPGYSEFDIDLIFNQLLISENGKVKINPKFSFRGDDAKLAVMSEMIQTGKNSRIVRHQFSGDSDTDIKFGTYLVREYVDNNGELQVEVLGKETPEFTYDNARELPAPDIKNVYTGIGKLLDNSTLDSDEQAELVKIVKEKTSDESSLSKFSTDIGTDVKNLNTEIENNNKKINANNAAINTAKDSITKAEAEKQNATKIKEEINFGYIPETQEY